MGGIHGKWRLKIWSLLGFAAAGVDCGEMLFCRTGMICYAKTLQGSWPVSNLYIPLTQEAELSVAFRKHEIIYKHYTVGIIRQGQ